MSYLDQITVDSTTYDLQDSGAQRVTLTGSSAPTTSTVGVVGQHYIDTSATAPPYEYVCINVSSGTYTWEPIGENEIYVGDTTPTGTAQQLWIDTGSSGTIQNVVCSVNGISPTSGGNVDLIPAVRPTYYIDGTNGSDSNDGSQSRPFATINKALDLIKVYKIQNIYPAIVYIAAGTYDEFLDLRRFPLELDINLQGDVTISGILCVYSTCFINADAGGGHKLTVQNSSNVTYPWGKMLISVNQGSIFDVKCGSSGSVELKTTDNTFTGISVARESNFYIQKAVFTNTTNTFAYPISIENTEAKIGSIVSSGTNIGRVHDSGTLFLGDINGGVNYTGTTIDGTSRIIFKPVKSVCNKTPDANGNVALVSSDVGAMSKWVLLWSNASPSSDFAAQTISLNLSGYDQIQIWFRPVASESDEFFAFAKVGSRIRMAFPRYTIERRFVSVTTTGVEFYPAYYLTSYGGSSESLLNAYMVPVRIYGIKGVQ